jgi:hypothetical protein
MSYALEGGLNRRNKKEPVGEEGRGGTFFGDTAGSGQNNTQ